MLDYYNKLSFKNAFNEKPCWSLFPEHSKGKLRRQFFIALTAGVIDMAVPMSPTNLVGLHNRYKTFGIDVHEPRQYKTIIIF